MIKNTDCKNLQKMNSHVNGITAARNGKYATGWKIYANSAYSRVKKYGSSGSSWQKRCSNGDKNWFGWCDGYCGAGYNVGKIETTLKGCGTARLDFGNCYTSYCQVYVYIDGKKIASANMNTPHKVVYFNFKNGSKLRITEGNDGRSCMMTFNSFKVISCRKCHLGIISIHLKILLNTISTSIQSE